MVKKKYRLKKKYKNFLIFYCFVSILYFSSFTLSRYVTQTAEGSSVGIANFSVKVNEESIQQGRLFKLKLSPNTKNTNKIAPDTEGNFQIKIDPSGTEVSLEYQITFELDNLYSGIQIKNCEVTDASGNVKKTIDTSSTNYVEGTILLRDKDNGLTEEDIVYIKVNWEWFEEDINEKYLTENIIPYTTIDISATVRQKIGNE